MVSFHAVSVVKWEMIFWKLNPSQRFIIKKRQYSPHVSENRDWILWVEYLKGVFMNFMNDSRIGGNP